MEALRSKMGNRMKLMKEATAQINDKNILNFYNSRETDKRRGEE
jgi:hypothetical protein